MTLSPDEFIAALALWREARNQSAPAQFAVFSVMLNRMKDAKHRWPRTLWEVVLQPFQFSSFNQGDANATKFPAPKNKSDWAAWLQCMGVVISGLQADPTQGANHYHDSSIAPPFKPWLGDNATLAQLQAKQTAQIGAFTFYKL